jgi:hypothetical protein
LLGENHKRNALYIAPNSRILNGLKKMWKEEDMRYYPVIYVEVLRQTTRISVDTDGVSAELRTGQPLVGSL